MGISITPNGPEIEEVKCLLIDVNGKEVGLLHFILTDLAIRANGPHAPEIQIEGRLLKGIELKPDGS